MKGFLQDELDDYQARWKLLTENKDLVMLQAIMYQLIYNIGYYAVCKDYIDNSLFINMSECDFIVDEINQLKDLLLNSKPSEELCEASGKVVDKIMGKIIVEMDIEIPE